MPPCHPKSTSVCTVVSHFSSWNHRSPPLITGSVQPYHGAKVSPALEGEYTVSGAKVKTAFQFYKEHLTQYTPEWAAGITGLSANSIRKVAQELGDNARIGSTIVVDGVGLPYRPVSIMAYHVAQ